MSIIERILRVLVKDQTPTALAYILTFGLVAVQLAFYGVVIYAAFHFIHKYW